MARAHAFDQGVLGLEPIYSDNWLLACSVAGCDVLLVFRKGTTGQTVTLPSGTPQSSPAPIKSVTGGQPIVFGCV